MVTMPAHKQSLPKRPSVVIPLLKASLVASLVFALAWLRWPLSVSNLTSVADIFVGFGILIAIFSMVFGIPMVLLMVRLQAGRWWVYLLSAALAGALLGSIFSSHPATQQSPNGDVFIERPFSITFSPWTRKTPGFVDSVPVTWADYYGSILFGILVGGALGISFWYFHIQRRTKAWT